MNEELIQGIHSKYFADKEYNQFRTDFINSPTLRQRVHDKYFSDKGDFNKFEADLRIQSQNTNQPESQQSSNVQQPTDQATEQPTAQQDNAPEPESDFHKALGKLPFGGILQKGADAITRGLHQGAQLSEGIDALVAGKNLDEQQTQAVADILKQNKRDTESDKSITSKFMKDEHLTIPEWAGFVAETVVQSGAMMLRGLFDAFTNSKSAKVLAAGAATGTAAGSLIPGVGNIAGLTSATLGSVSGMMEASGMYFDELQQEIDKRKLPLNASSVKQVISDDAWLSRVRERATVKGLVVGSVDAITAGLSAKLGSKLKDEIIKKGLEGTPLRKAVAKTAGKVLLNEMAGGGGGEAASEVAIGDPLDYHQIVPELVGELGGGANVVTPFLGKGGSEVRAAIAEAKERKIKEAGKTPPPSGPAAPAAPAEDLADKSLSIGDVIDAHTKLTINRDKDTNMIDQTMLDHSLSDMAVRHTSEEFNSILDAQAKAEGLSAEEVQSISSKFDEAKQIADKFNTPDLMADPSTRSLAVKARLDANRVQSQIDETTKAMDSADEAVKPQWKAKLDDLNTQLKAHNDTISAIVNKKPVDNTSPAEKPVTTETPVEVKPAEEPKLRTGSFVDYQGIKGKVVEEGSGVGGDVKAKNKAFEELVNLIPTTDLRRPNGSIGTQGFSPENLVEVARHIAKEMGFDIPAYDKNKGTSEIKQVIDYLKNNKEAQQKIRDYVVKDPVVVSLLPDNTYEIEDGNHRANLLNLIGVDVIPTIELNGRDKQTAINEHNSKVEAVEQSLKETTKAETTTTNTGVEEDGIRYVQSDDGTKTVIEGGTNPDATLKDLQVTELVPPGKEKKTNVNEIKTDFSSNTVTVNGVEHDYVKSNTNNNGEDVSVTLKDRETGKEKTFRKPEDVESILTDKVQHESQQSGQSTADLVGQLENHAESTGISESRPNKRNTKGISEPVRREETTAALRELSKQKFDQIDNSKKTLDEVDKEMSEMSQLINDEVNALPVQSDKAPVNGFLDVFDQSSVVDEAKTSPEHKKNAGILSAALHQRVPNTVLKALGAGNINKGKELIAHYRRLNERRFSLQKENAINQVKSNKLEASQLEGNALAIDRNEKLRVAEARIKDLETKRDAALKKAASVEASNFTAPKEISAKELKKVGATSTQMIAAKEINRETTTRFNEFKELLKKINDCK